MNKSSRSSTCGRITNSCGCSAYAEWPITVVCHHATTCRGPLDVKIQDATLGTWQFKSASKPPHGLDKPASANTHGPLSTLQATPVFLFTAHFIRESTLRNISGPKRRLIYCPDIDRWEGEILETIEGAEIALVDGTFYSANEVPDCDISEIPHLCISDFVKTFERWETEIQFIHLNHTNQLLSNDGLVSQLGARGVGLGKRGDVWRL